MMYICAWHAPELAPERLISSRITDASVTLSPPPPYSVGNQRREPAGLGERLDERLGIRRRALRPPASTGCRTARTARERPGDTPGCSLQRGLMSFTRMDRVRQNAVISAEQSRNASAMSRTRDVDARRRSRAARRVAPARRDERHELVLELPTSSPDSRDCRADKSLAPRNTVPSASTMSTRAGHAAGYLAVRSSATVTRVRASSAARSRVDAHRLERTGPAEHVQRRAAFEQRGGDAVREAELRRYGVLRIVLLHDLVSRAVRLDVDRRDVRIGAVHSRAARADRARRRSRVCVWPQHAADLVAVLADLPLVARVRP